MTRQRRVRGDLPGDSRLVGVLLDVDARSLDELFALAAGAIAGPHRKAVVDITRRLKGRHAHRTPGLGRSVTLPHASSALAVRVQALFLRTASPIEVGAPDGARARHHFVLVVPRPVCAHHAQLLQRLQERLRQDGVTGALAGPAAGEVVRRLWSDVAGL